MIGIIGAMASEVDALKANMTDKKIITKAKMEFCSGTLFGKKAVVVKCGVGKVNAALCVQNMINEFSPDLIINTGCAAGVGDGVHTRDIVIAKNTVQHDVDYGPLDDERGYLDIIERVYVTADEENSEKIAKIARELGVNTFMGTIATGDQFLCDKGIKEDIKNHFGAYAVEMEGGAVAHAAFLNGVPFVILRSISDAGDDEAIENFEKFVEEVNKINMAILEEFLKND